MGFKYQFSVTLFWIGILIFRNYDISACLFFKYVTILLNLFNRDDFTEFYINLKITIDSN